MARRRLTDQQKARIAEIQDRRRQRAAQRAAGDLDNSVHGEQHTGRVVVRHGRSLLIRTDDGRELLGALRANIGEAVCGDRVVWQAAGEGHAIVVALLPRESALTRPSFGGQEKTIAANITQLVVVLAPQPEPTGYLLDQYLVAAERIGVRGLICLNKADLLDAAGQARFRERFGHYEAIGYPLIQISAKTEHGLDPLRDRLNGQTSILVGQSGVGKSSLINALVDSCSASEGALSEATGLGRHTTSAATLYPLRGGGELIDSPGVRSFRLGRLERQELERGFREFLPYLGQCRFHNCAHLAEPDCAILAAVEAGQIRPERLASYQHLAAEGLATD